MPIAALDGCRQDDRQLHHPATASIPPAPIGALPIPVSSDPDFRYHALSWTDKGDGLIEITTRRASTKYTPCLDKGQSSTWAQCSVFYATRLIDCERAEFTYLAEGDKLEAMHENKQPQMAPVTSGSISTYVAIFACDQIGM